MYNIGHFAESWYPIALSLIIVEIGQNKEFWSFYAQEPLYAYLSDIFIAIQENKAYQLV